MKHWLNEGLEMLKVLRKARKQSREKSNKKRRNHNRNLRSESLQAWGYRIKSDMTRKASSNIVVDLTVGEESLTHFLSTWLTKHAMKL